MLAKYGTCVFAIYLLFYCLNRTFLPARHPLWPIVLFLFMVGWTELFRLRHDLAAKQCLWLLISISLASVVGQAKLRVSSLERYRTPLLVGAVALLYSALLFGVEVNGAKLWLRLGGLSFQPIELVKVLLIITLASFWRRFRLWLRFRTHKVKKPGLPKRGMLFLVLGWLVSLAILVVQKDLGMALLLIGVLFTTFYVALGRRNLVIGGVGAFFVASTAVILSFSHVRIRIKAWWDPFGYAESAGGQMVEALYALSDGGPWGRGLFLGRPYLIPEAHNDFILMAICNELGWLVAVAMIAAFASASFHIFRMAVHCRGEFRRLLLAGFASLWSLQAFILIAGTTKVIPMTGLTLPFVSYGGSSLLANTVLLALVVKCEQD